jgi:hypothetical protein
MRALDSLPRLAELSLGAARHALSIARRIAEPILGRRSREVLSGWDRRWEPRSSRPVAEPPPPPSAPRRPPATPPATATPPPTPPPAAKAPSAPPPAAAPRPAPQPVAPAPPPEPTHVDRDAVLVAESADAAAADGAGPQIQVDEPWNGYGKLTAKDVTAQLATADAATLAIVRLYESTHRKRRTVLAAVDRRLAAANR